MPLTRPARSWQIAPRSRSVGYGKKVARSPLVECLARRVGEATEVARMSRIPDTDTPHVRRHHARLAMRYERSETYKVFFGTSDSPLHQQIPYFRNPAAFQPTASRCMARCRCQVGRDTAIVTGMRTSRTAMQVQPHDYALCPIEVLCSAAD